MTTAIAGTTVESRRKRRTGKRVDGCDLSVVIVSYRSSADLRRCLPTWARGVEGIRAELILVENGTGEDLRSQFGSVVPEARFRILSESVGFGAAVNEGLRSSRGRHVALLNPDTRLEAGSLARLVTTLDENPGIGIVGPRVWDDDARTSLQRSWRSFPGLATSLFNRNSWLTRVWPGNPWSRRYLNADADPGRFQDTDWVSGCCMVVRGTLFRGLAGLDVRYPLFCEDVDICREARRHGFRVAYDPAAEIVHEIGGSRRGVPLRSAWLRHRSMSWYILKYRGAWNPVAWALVGGVWGRFVMQALRRRG